MPGEHVNALEMKPILDQVPKPQGEPTLTEEVSHGFLLAFAQGVKAAVWPCPFGQPINSPNSVLNSQPNKEFDPRRHSCLPNRVVHGGTGSSTKLCVVGGCRGLEPAGCMFPNNLIINIGVKVEVMEGCPKGHEFTNVSHGEVC